MYSCFPIGYRDRGVEIEFPSDRKKKGEKKVVDSRLVKVVKIPWDERLPYQELEIPVENGKNGDQLLERLRVYFNQGSVEMDALKEAASKQFSSESVTISEDTISKLTALGNVELFPLAHPVEANGNCKVGLYLDEAGQLKKLPPNPRAVALANTCGFNDVPLVGDMFVGRSGTSSLGITNFDFTLDELNSSSSWLKDIQKHNYEFGLSTNRVTMQDSDIPPTEGKSASKGYRWSETNELMEVTVAFPTELAKVVSKDVKVKFTSKSLEVSIRNSSSGAVTDKVTLMQVEPQQYIGLLSIPTLAGAIRPDDSTWSINGKELEISMEKVNSSNKWGKLEQ